MLGEPGSGRERWAGRLTRRAHFDEVSEQTAGHGGAVKTRKFFECVHCGWKMRSSFAADVGRAHLSANKDLAQDVCTGADDDAASRHAKFEQETKDASVGARRRPRRLLLPPPSRRPRQNPQWRSRSAVPMPPVPHTALT